MTTQLTLADNYNPTKSMVFDDPQVCSIPNSTLSYKRIPIKTINPDGTKGDLVILTENVFSFGVCENLDITTKKLNGYVFPLCLHSRDGATKKELAWVDVFNKIVDTCKDHILKIKEEIGEPEMEKSDLKKLNCLYYKKDNGKVVDGATPTLYAKIMYSKKDDKIITKFYDTVTSEEIDAMSLLKKHCVTSAAVKIESLYIGSKITLQVKLYEADVRLLQSGNTRLISKPKSNPTVLLASALTTTSSYDEDAGSIDGDDEKPKTATKPLIKDAEDEEAEEEEEPSPVVKKIVKKIVKGKK